MTVQDGQPGIGRRAFVKAAAVAAGGLAGAGGVATTAAAEAHVGAEAGRPVSRPVTVRPGDARYPDLTSGLNQRWTAHPDEVRLLTSTDQVVAAVTEAVRAGKRISVRSGGHCYEDFVYNPEVEVIIDLSEYRGVVYDERMRAFSVAPGTQLLDLYELLYRIWGVSIPAGTTATVGTAGLVLGGGYGLLSRRDGLAADHLYAVEVVTVDSHKRVRAVVATRERTDPNRDLWWAHTGGGGGNFGIVTKLWFRSPGATGADPARLLPRPPARVLVSQVGIPWSALTAEGFGWLLRNFGEWFATHQRAGTPYGDAFSFLILNHVSAGGIALITQTDATVPNAAALLDRYLHAIIEGVVPASYLTPAAELPWLRATHLIATSGIVADPTLRAEHKSAYLRSVIPGEHVSAMYRHLTDPSFANPNAMVVVYSYGARINEVAPSATASAQRGSVLKLLYQAFWHAPSDDAANINWLRNFYSDVYAATGGVPVPNALTEGCYVNYPDIDLSNPAVNRSTASWHDLYYQDNYLRLRRVKGRWDPRNVFHHAQSVEPPEQ